RSELDAGADHGPNRQRLTKPRTDKETGMISRRQVNLGLGTLALLSFGAPAVADEKKKFLVTNPNGAIDATQCFSTCGHEPRLGYYAMEGIQRGQLAVNRL